MGNDDACSEDTDRSNSEKTIIDSTKKGSREKRKRSNRYQRKYRGNVKQRWIDMQEELFGQQLELAEQLQEIETHKDRIKELDEEAVLQEKVVEEKKCFLDAYRTRYKKDNEVKRKLTQEIKTLKNELKIRDEMITLYTLQMHGNYTRCHVPRHAICFPTADVFETGMDNVHASYGDLPYDWLVKVHLNMAGAVTHSRAIHRVLSSLIQKCLDKNEMPLPPTNFHLQLSLRKFATHASKLACPKREKLTAYMEELGPERPCCVAFFPLTMAGLLIEIWDHDEGGTGSLFFIPYGKIVVFPATVVYSHNFMTALDGNLLAITQLFVNLGRKINDEDTVHAQDIDQSDQGLPKYLHVPELISALVAVNV